MEDSEQQSIAAILLAGGSGRRLSTESEDKILLKIGEKPIIQYSMEAFAESESVDTLAIVFRNERQRQAIAKAVPETLTHSLIWVKGGAERQDSVWAGLQALPSQTDIVLIHDGARPMITSQAIGQVALAAETSQAACVASRVTNTIKKVEHSNGGYVLNTLNRDELWSMETPQAFKYSLIYDGYSEVIASSQKITDDLAAIESQSVPVAFIENPNPNPKLTNPEDIAYLEFLMRRFPN